MYAAGWPPSPEDPNTTRDRIHRIALAEARIASEHEGRSARPTDSVGLLDRVRRAIGLAPVEPDCVAYPA